MSVTRVVSLCVSLAFLEPTVSSLAAQNTVLVPQGAVWRFLDDGSDQGVNWREPRFSDAQWKSGKAKLGYGGDGEVTSINFGSSPKRKFTTTYFRATFNVNDRARFNHLLIRLIRDDGAVVYINGREVWRDNMPGRTVTFATRALDGMSDRNEKVWYERITDATSLVEGTNVIAVEVHQNIEDSSDLGFDLELMGFNGPFGVSLSPMSDTSMLTGQMDYVRKSSDSSGIAFVIRDLRKTGAVKLTKTLHERATVALDRRDSINGRWLLQEADMQALLARGTALPAFMRVPPAVFRVPTVSPSSRKISFFALGDWGNFNRKEQLAVSEAVRASHKRTPFDFGVLTGDNFYARGIDSPVNPRWESEYESQYGVMGVPIYVALGNHDFYSSNSAAAEVSYTHYSRTDTWKLPATHYTFTAGSVDAPLAQFFVIETENFTPYQAMWLDSVLEQSRAQWKIVVGHHDIYSNRRYDGTGVEDSDNFMIARSLGMDVVGNLLVPLLKKHKVQIYVNGHYHSLQHHQVNSVDYITSGGGGGGGLYKLYEEDSLKYNARRKFAVGSNGFASMEITPEAFNLEFINDAGKVLYKYRRPK